jgi:hypothetical protein
MRRKIIFLFILFALSLQTGCMYAIRYDGAYKGKVVDETTREPIEGVVVLGVWYKTAPTVAGAVSTYYDARETVTDKNGAFEIPGKGLRIMTDLAPMEILVFKAGYDYIDLGPWEGLKESVTLSKKVKWEGEKPIIPLKKLTMEERKNRHTGKAILVPDAKQKLLIKESNKEYSDIGLPPYTEVK